MFEYRVLDMERYPRLQHYKYFSAMPNPMLGITVKTDVTRLVDFCRNNKFSFYMGMTHVSCLAANRIPQLRQRKSGNGIIEYTQCGTSHIELLPDETYCYCTMRHDMPWDEFIPYAQQCRRKAVEHPGIAEDHDVDALYFVTTLPWLHYEQLSMPVAHPVTDNPRFCWGKYEADIHGRLILPFTLQANHALADGIHIAAFFRSLQEEIDSLL